jgi:F0F1-type ATP synthase membrane subunit b/b'
MFLLAFAEQSIQLFPDGTLFIHIALILIMIGVLNRTFFKPINRVLAARDKHKFGPGGEAEKILNDALEKEAKLNKEMLSARTEGYELIEKQRNAAVELRAKKIAEAKAETASKFAAEKQVLTEQAEAARAAIAVEAEVMADRIAANVLKG